MTNELYKSFIDVPLWNKAGWLGVAYLFSEHRPPLMGLLFRNFNAGSRIFDSWKAALGDTDHHDLLRISFIEGAVPGLLPGYFIKVSTNGPALIELAASQGNNLDFVLYESRIHRMNPPPGSANLSDFKKHFAKHKGFTLAQVRAGTNGEVLVNQQSVLQKSEAVFRLYEEIDEGDIDAEIRLAPR